MMKGTSYLTVFNKSEWKHSKRNDLPRAQTKRMQSKSGSLSVLRLRKLRSGCSLQLFLSKFQAARKGILITFVLAALLLAACAGGQPQINLEATHFDFGDVVNGEILSRDLVISNDGNEAIIAQSVSTTCGCTTATLEPMTIPPGGFANLHITFDSGAHGPELTGLITRQIFITSNDPDQPEAMVEFTANIIDKGTP